MLGEIFDRFVEESAVTVMTRGLLERLLNPGQLDAWFERTAQKQYTRELLFSTVVDLLMQVVCGVRKSVNVAYQAVEHEMPVSVQSVYNKLNGLEPHISAELVRFSAQEATGLIEELGAQRAGLLPGYRVKMLDGNCLEASEHRLKELRELSGGALPGKSLVVYDPALGLAVDVFPCEDGHAQERSLLPSVLETVGAGEVWVADRNFCVKWFLLGIERQGGFLVMREHEQLPWTPLEAMWEAGQTETGSVAEQAIAVIDDEGKVHRWRRIRVRLNKPTRDGESTIYILTNLPATVKACTVAELYRKRWTIETAFQQLEKNFESEIPAFRIKLSPSFSPGESPMSKKSKSPSTELSTAQRELIARLVGPLEVRGISRLVFCDVLADAEITVPKSSLDRWVRAHTATGKL